MKLNKIKINFILRNLGYFFLVFTTNNVFCARLHPRVARGQYAEPGQFPFHVAVKTLMSNKAVPLCGGSIINEKWVLTAAHCLVVKYRDYDKGINVEKVTIVAGDIFLDPISNSVHTNSRQEIIASKYIYPLNYESRCQTWDIGLVQLSESLEFNNQIRPISLPEASMNLPPDTQCTVSGWGVDENEQLTAKLRWGKVTIIEENKCTNALNFEITNARVCAGVFEGGTHGCAGDSGSPLACKGQNGQYYLYGATSFGLPGKKCGDSENPTVYTKVNVYRSWIDCIIKTSVKSSATESAYSCQHLITASRGKSKFECVDSLESSGFATVGQFPYHVAVNSEFTKLKTITCGGVILNTRWVLTAAQCLIENNVKSKAVVITSDIFFIKPGRSTTQQQVETDMHIVPENYRSGCKTYNIGLASLSKNLAFNYYIGSINLPDQTLSGDCLVTGWGVPVNKQIATQTLKWAKINIISNTICENLLDGFYVSGSKICAGVLKGNRAGCTSDIGGPLVCQDKSGNSVVRGVAIFRSPKAKYGFGLLSPVKNCEEKDNPVIYTLVSHYLKWIKCVMAAKGTSEQIEKNCQKEIRIIKTGHGECGNGVAIIVFLFVFLFVTSSTIIFLFYLKRINTFKKKSVKGTESFENHKKPASLKKTLKLIN